MLFLEQICWGVNKTTSDRGLSFLDIKTIERLKKVGYFSEKDILREFEENRIIIRGLVEKVYDDVLSIGASSNRDLWEKDIKILQDPNISEEKLLEIRNNNPVIIMSQLWKANNLRLKDCFLKLIERYESTIDWGIIGTIVDSNFCPSKILDKYGRGIGKEKGFGYLLRIIARNPNTSYDTLKSIAEDQSLEQRYKVIAKAALVNGIEGTKGQL